MKRITLLGASKSTPPDLTWDVQVCNAVRCGDHDALLALVSQPGAKRLLREGFSIDGQSGHPFAKLCLHFGAVDTLRAVVAAAPNGVTLKDTCVRHVIVDSRGVALEVCSEMQLHEESVDHAKPSPQALALALELEPDHPCITEHLERFNGASLHYRALYNASMSRESGCAQKLADCCRLLITKGAPISHRSRSTSCAYDMLFRYRWNRDGLQDVMVPLLGDYVRSGLINLDQSPRPGSHPPVIQAILAGNGYAAAAAIDLGCDTELAVRGFKPEEYKDLLDVTRACESPDLADQTVALVTEALMRRKLGAAPYLAGAAAPARKRRAGL